MAVTNAGKISRHTLARHPLIRAPTRLPNILYFPDFLKKQFNSLKNLFSLAFEKVTGIKLQKRWEKY